MSWSQVEQAFERAAQNEMFPGATVRASLCGQPVFEGAFGMRSLVPERVPMRLDTVFDLSSLTKPLATTSAVMLLVQEGKLRLDDRVARLFPDFGVQGKGTLTWRNLLAHCSGLSAWRPFYREIEALERGGRVNFMSSRAARQYVYEQVHRERPEITPLTKSVYSDLNFIMLGEAVERITSMTLDSFCRQRVFRPLGLVSTDFIDLTQTRTRRLKPVAEMFAPTELCPFRKRVLVGEVDDENAWAMGGVAGHAGLFAPLTEVDRLASELVAAYAGKSGLWSQKIVREFWRRDSAVYGSTWALGWDTPSPGRSSAGRHFSPGALGHLGFTGTSIWIDPERQLVVTILTNRVHPSRANEAIREFRPRAHDLILEELRDA